MKNDNISRQAAIDAVRKSYDEILDFSSDGHTIADSVEDIINMVPPAQPEPAIPLSWIENYIKWLNSLDNGFSTLEALQIGLMVRKWKDEQDDE